MITLILGFFGFSYNAGGNVENSGNRNSKDEEVYEL